MRLRKPVKIILTLLLIVILIVTAIFGFATYKKLSHSKTKEDQKEVVVNNNQIEQDKEELEAKKKAYEDCMKQPYKMDTLDEEFNALMDSYQGKSLAIYFTDVNNDYSYSLNPNKAYYSGCVTKIFLTIYLIEQARAGEIDLHQTLTYLPRDKKPFSDLMDKHSFYEEIPMTTLIDYYMTVSDNTAFFVIINKYGTAPINKYFKEKYNITLHFTDNHPFEANYTADLGNKSLIILNDLLQVDDEYTALVKKAMDNDSENGLNFDDMRFLHKYGEYDIYHNDIGIYDSENPYLVTILTHYAYDDYIGKISSINKELYTLYKKNLDSKEQYCESIMSEKTGG